VRQDFLDSRVLVGSLDQQGVLETLVQLVRQVMLDLLVRLDNLAWLDLQAEQEQLVMLASLARLVR